MLRIVPLLIAAAVFTAGVVAAAIPEPSAGSAAASITVSATVLDAGPSAAALDVMSSLLAQSGNFAPDWTREGLARVTRLDPGIPDDPRAPDAVMLVEFVAN